MIPPVETSRGLQALTVVSGPVDKLQGMNTDPFQPVITSPWVRDRFPFVTRTLSHQYLGTGIETKTSVVRWIFTKRSK